MDCILHHIDKLGREEAVILVKVVSYDHDTGPNSLITEM